MLKNTILLVSLLMVGCGGGGTTTTPISTPVPPPVTPTPTPTVSHIPENFCYWEDRGNTNVSTCGVVHTSDPNAQSEINDIISSGRMAIVWPDFFGFSNGYTLQPDYVSRWAITKALLGPNLGKALIYLADEPDSVGWGNTSDHNVNAYNSIIQTVIDMVHADGGKIAANYGGAEAGLVIPNLDVACLESYNTMPLSQFEALLKPGTRSCVLFKAYRDLTNGATDTPDAQIATTIQGFYAQVKQDPNVTLVFPFRYCLNLPVCDGNNFYTVGGGSMPATLATLTSIGMEIKNR